MDDQISDSQLLEFNKKGLIPGPREQSYHFLSRVRNTLQFANNFEDIIQDDNSYPFNLQNLIPGEVKKEAFNTSKELYDICPDWTPAVYSNHSLSLWHGGCAWIPDSLQANGSVFFQLRQSFKNSERFLWIYNRREILAHESSHTGRMAFKEPLFEELLAYRSSPSKFRKYLGPLIQRPEEASIFLILLGIIASLDVFFLTSDLFSLYYSFMYLKLLPILMLALFFWRTYRLQNTFSKCLNNLDSLLKDKKKANAVIYRLTDREIQKFSTQLPQKILQYANERKAHSLRWRLIYLAYFS